MPWNDQSGGSQGGPPGGSKGPWGGGPRQPWGTPPRPSQPPPGDLEDILRQFRDRFRFGGGGGGGGGGGRRSPISAPIIAGILFVGWILTGLYLVDEGERAVITRLGDFSRVTGPGMHMHLPTPFEAHQIYNVTGQRVERIGFTLNGQTSTDVDSESLMLTGDRNIVNIHFNVFYTIKDVRQFAFNVRDLVSRDGRPGAVRQVAESVMREEIGRRELELIITRDRGAVEQAVQRPTQQVLDEYQSGVQIMQVQLATTAAPPAVAGAFNDVISANQEAETAVNNARRDTARIVAEAQGYRERTMREATGEAQRFLAVYEEYRQAPQVTRDRIYTETMERVYRTGNLVILDSRGGNVTYLPLEGMIRRNSGTTTPPPQAEGTR